MPHAPFTSQCRHFCRTARRAQHPASANFEATHRACGPHTPLQSVIASQSAEQTAKQGHFRRGHTVKYRSPHLDFFQSIERVMQ
jgi:hypothetical protein